MSDLNTSQRHPRYTTIAIVLHWLIALAIIGMIFLGWNMGENAKLYQIHKSIGISILILTIARIVWRLMNPPPPLGNDMPKLEKTASHLVHLGFYGLMLAMPLTGWLLVSTTYEFNISTVLFGVVSWPDIPGVGFLANEQGHGAVEFVHSKLAWLALGLLALHVAGAIKHEITDESGVLKRMIPGLFGKTDGPPAPARGAVAAFGLAVLVFAAITLPPALMRGGSSSAFDLDFKAANWTIDHDASALTFSGDYDGTPYNGGFDKWDAAIIFLPDDLAASRVEVAVDLASVTANLQRYADDLRDTEWFNVADHPIARISLNNFAITDTGYTATAAVTIKENTVQAPFTFELAITGDRAQMTGGADLSRIALDLGLTSDADADWVADLVRVDVAIEADRTP